MTKAAIARARKEAAIAASDGRLPQPRPKPEPVKCYVCGSEMASRGLPGGQERGGICGRCMGNASRQKELVRRSREVAERQQRRADRGPS